VKRDGNGVASDRDAERVRWVRRYRTSGLGLKRFAQRYGLNAGQLHYWVYGLDQSKVPEPPAPVFREVRLPTTVRTSSAWSAEVGLAEGTTVRLVGGTDLSWTLALIESLRRPCSH
jgi:transposase-like protein